MQKRIDVYMAGSDQYEALIHNIRVRVYSGPNPEDPTNGPTVEATGFGKNATFISTPSRLYLRMSAGTKMIGAKGMRALQYSVGAVVSRMKDRG